MPAWLAKLVTETEAKPHFSKWMSVDSLPPLALQGRVADASEIAAILQGLQRLTEEAKTTLPPFIMGIWEDCEPLSRDAFVYALYDRYHADERPKTGRWVNLVVRFLGGQRCALRIGSQVKQWAEALNRVGANLGIELLEAIGTDTAIMQLDMLARKVRRNSVKVRAQQAVKKIAAARGLTEAELADRIVPDCGLDEQGTRCFDFGPRQFWFAAGPQLEPRICDAEGRIRADLPALRQSDDPAKSAEAVAAWKLLKKSLRETLKVQGERLEQAMVQGRSWPFEQFEQLFLRHPLMRHLAQLVIWAECASDGSVVRTFRVCEDLTFADACDQPAERVIVGNVRIVHPLHLTEAARLQWAHTCADYVLLPPFDQIQRRVERIAPGEKTQKTLKPRLEMKIHPLSLLSKLTRLGWQRGEPEDAGLVCEHRKFYLSENITAVLRYGGGIPVQDPRWAEPQSIEECLFLPGLKQPERWDNFKGRLALGEVSDLVLSETLRDLALLTGMVG